MWKKSYSVDRPQTTDTISSKIYNYVRRNITEKTDTDGSIYYEYEELKVHKEDWELYLNLQQLEAEQEQQNEVLDFLLMGGAL